MDRAHSSENNAVQKRWLKRHLSKMSSHALERVIIAWLLQNYKHTQSPGETNSVDIDIHIKLSIDSLPTSRLEKHDLRQTLVDYICGAGMALNALPVRKRHFIGQSVPEALSRDGRVLSADVCRVYHAINEGIALAKKKFKT